MRTISTHRLHLKPITPAIIRELFSTKEKTEICTFLGLDETRYEKYKQMHEQGAETFRISMHCFLLFDKHTDRPLGECGFHTWNKTHHRAEIFYHIHDEQDRNKRYISEALPVILEYGFNEMNLHRIEALLASHNTPSVKLINRFGFVKEGTMRQHYLINDKYEDSDSYSLLKEEWEPIKQRQNSAK